MKVLVTGASGFVGRWLTRDLTAAGHDVIAAPPSSELDIADPTAARELVAAAAPDAIAHLAAVASAGAAARDPERAIRTNIGGTVALTEAAARLPHPPGLLVASSAEVYAAPEDGGPLSERSPTLPRHPYGLLKLAQESVALAAATHHALPLIVARPFNHTGPGQAPVSAAASFAHRIALVRRGASQELEVGNLDVERDIGDVRDFAVAYRLLLEGMAAGRVGTPPATFNIATGRALRVRTLVDELCRLAEIQPRIVVNPAFVRADDPPRIVGDAGALREATGWSPAIPLERTLAEMLEQHLHEP